MLTKTFRIDSSNIGAAQSTPVCPHYMASKLLRWGHVNFPAPSLPSLADQTAGNALTGEQRLSRFQQQMLRVAACRPVDPSVTPTPYLAICSEGATWKRSGTMGRECRVSQVAPLKPDHNAPHATANETALSWERRCLDSDVRP